MCFFSFFVEGYQMDPAQLRMIWIILRIRNPYQNLDFPLDSNSFQFAKWKPKKKKLWRPNTSPTSNPSQPQSHPLPNGGTKKWDASIQIPIRSPPQGSLVLERSLQIAQSEHRPSVNVAAGVPSLCGTTGKKKGFTEGICRFALFPCPFKRNQRGNWKNVVRSKKSPMQAASPHPQEWPWHSKPQRSVGPRPTKWDGDVGQHSKPAECHWNINVGKCGVRPY